DLGPGIYDICGVVYRNRGLMQQLTPLNEILLNLPRPSPEIVTGPNSISLQIPPQLLRFDRTNWCNEPPALSTHHFPLAWRCRLIDQPRARRGARDAILFMEFQIGEFEDEFFERLGFRLRG